MDTCVVQIEAVLDIVNVGFDRFFSDCGEVNLSWQRRNLEFVRLARPIFRCFACFVADAVFQQSHTAFDNRIPGIIPLVRIVAHQEAAMGMQMDS